MVGYVVALVVQVGREVVRAIVECGGPPSEDAYVLSQSFGATLATQLVVAATALLLARRLEGRARSGVELAAVAYSAIAVCTVARDVLVHTSSHAGYAWVMWMHEYGWSALEVIAIAGLTFAAGRRFWLAPPAAGLVMNALWVAGAWSAAEARIGELPRWRLYVAVTFTLWAMFRTARVWIWTLIRLWDHFDQGMFTEVHWTVLLPGMIGTIAMYGALAVTARRARSSELFATVGLATVSSGIAFGVSLALHHHGAIAGACYIVANLVAARMCRMARATLATELPTARAL